MKIVDCISHPFFTAGNAQVVEFKHKHEFETIYSQVPVIIGMKPGFLRGLFSKSDYCKCGFSKNHGSEEIWLPITSQEVVKGPIKIEFKM